MIGGLFARPLRGYAEAAADLSSGLDRRAILQFACGAPRRVNSACDLRWW
ncbi:MAG TPA: hypothetical protein VMS43_04165 [Allosphingosinicella sp.]|nr:hypothetical protein [Allosphingosinicella sp.]